MDTTLILTAVKVGAGLVGRLWHLLQNNRPTYEMTQALGSGLYVIPRGATMDTISRCRWPKVQVRRMTGYYASCLIRLVDIEPKAIWYCSNYMGCWYIVDARVAVDVRALRASQDVSAQVVFHQPYWDATGAGVRVAVLPLDLWMRHSNPINHRECTSVAMIHGDGRLEHVS